MLTSLPSNGPTVVQQKSHVTYTLPVALEIGIPDQFVLSESRTLISSSGTTGLRTWEGSLHLAHFLLTDEGKTCVTGKVILELGAGTGMLSVLCAKFLDASRVIATDGVAGVVESMKENFLTSGLNIPKAIECELLRWGWMLKGAIFDETTERNSVDTVLGADIVSMMTTEHLEVYAHASQFRHTMRPLSLHYWLRYEISSIGTL